jgi:hypothetical protein
MLSSIRWFVLFIASAAFANDKVIVVAVAGNPLTDITELERMKFVMKGGEVYKINGELVAPKP